MPELNKELLELLSKSTFVTTRNGGKYTVELRLENGAVITGTPGQVRDAIEKTGIKPDPNKYYFSESHGEYLEIEKMASIHIRNATLKMQKEWLETLYRILDPQEYALAVAKGLDDKTFVAMMVVLLNRKS